LLLYISSLMPITLQFLLTNAVIGLMFAAFYMYVMFVLKFLLNLDLHWT